MFPAPNSPPHQGTSALVDFTPEHLYKRTSPDMFVTNHTNIPPRRSIHGLSAAKIIRTPHKTVPVGKGSANSLMILDDVFGFTRLEKDENGEKNEDNDKNEDN